MTYCSLPHASSLFQCPRRYVRCRCGHFFTSHRCHAILLFIEQTYAHHGSHRGTLVREPAGHLFSVRYNWLQSGEEITLKSVTNVEIILFFSTKRSCRYQH